MKFCYKCYNQAYSNFLAAVILLNVPTSGYEAKYSLGSKIQDFALLDICSLRIKTGF